MILELVAWTLLGGMSGLILGMAIIDLIAALRQWRKQ